MSKQRNPLSAERSVPALALGRIFRMASRPAQPGDVEEYERCRRIFLDAVEPNLFQNGKSYQPNYARDRNRGAAGD